MGAVLWITSYLLRESWTRLWMNSRDEWKDRRTNRSEYSKGCILHTKIKSENTLDNSAWSKLIYLLLVLTLANRQLRPTRLWSERDISSEKLKPPIELPLQIRKIQYLRNFDNWNSVTTLGEGLFWQNKTYLKYWTKNSVCVKEGKVQTWVAKCPEHRPIRLQGCILCK